MSAQLSMFEPPTSPDTASAISSPASGPGPARSATPTGRKTARSGPDRRHVSRFRSLDSDKELSTDDTSGPLFTASSPSAALQRSLESRLRARMGGSGWPLFATTWRPADMPSGPPSCRLAVFGAPHIRYRLFFVAQSSGVADAGRQRRQQIAGSAPGDEEADGRARWDGGQSHGDHFAASDGATGGLADGARFADGAWDGRAVGWLRPPDSIWSDADWIFCRDNKWRPIEPGSFPLVDGTAFDLGSGGPYEGMSRAGMLRGYGNAIVLPVAVAFVEAAMEVLPCT
jgi:hypothetical protein